MFGWRHYECKYIIIYHKNWDCMLLPTLCPWSSMENFHPLHQTPHTLMRWNWQIAALSLHRTAPNLAHKKLCLIYWVHIQKYFVDFFSYFKNFADLSYMLTPLLLQPFSWPFWPSFTSHLCRETLVHRECRDPLVSNSVQAILTTPDAPWNSQHNHATRLNIFSVTCVFFPVWPMISLFLRYLHQWKQHGNVYNSIQAQKFPWPFFQWPWNASYIMSNAPWNSQHHHATMLDIFDLHVTKKP